MKKSSLKKAGNSICYRLSIFNQISARDSLQPLVSKRTQWHSDDSWRQTKKGTGQTSETLRNSSSIKLIWKLIRFNFFTSASRPRHKQLPSTLLSENFKLSINEENRSKWRNSINYYLLPRPLLESTAVVVSFKWPSMKCQLKMPNFVDFSLWLPMRTCQQISPRLSFYFRFGNFSIASLFEVSRLET